MKTKSLLWIIAMCMVFIGCERKNQPEENHKEKDTTDTSVVPEPCGPYALMTIVKFDDPELLNKIIAQHQIVGWDDVLEIPKYDEEKDLSLNFYEIWPDVVPFVEEKMSVSGISPYIPLTDGYYMIDWKWHQFMPLSALCLQNTDAYLEHLNEHIFLTDIDWKDMVSMTAEYDRSKYTQHIEGMEIKRIVYMYLDMLYDDIKPASGGPYYSCYGDGIYYYNGMCANTAYEFSLYGPCSYHPDETYQGYISYCDSLQNIYQQRMIKIIETGQLSKVEATW